MIEKKKKIAILLFNLILFINGGTVIATEETHKSAIETKNKEEILKEKDISLRVVALEVRVGTEESHLVSAVGSLKNNTGNLVKNIRIKIVLTDTENNRLAEFPLEETYELYPASEKAFKGESFIQTPVSVYELRGFAEILESESTNVVEIANWFLNSNRQKLSEWNIPFNESDFANESAKRVAALKVLNKSLEQNMDLPEVRQLIAEIKYSEAKKMLENKNLDQAMISLLTIARENSEADKLIKKYRSAAIAEKVETMLKDNKKNYQTINLLRSIPPGDENYRFARNEIKKILVNTKKNPLRVETFNKKNYSEDQQKVLELMENLPNRILEKNPNKDEIIWVFSDYSYFSFDKKGQLVNYNLYPLY